MKSFKGLLLAILVLTWGATLLLAAPVPSSSFHLSLALPVQTIDFSDLDVRDANNRPVAVAQFRQRFEDVLNRELNRLLIENLTPLRRAWIEALSHERDVFGTWLQRSAKAAHQWIWTAAGRTQRWLASATSRHSLAANVTAAAAQRSDKNFVALPLLLISSTRLLR